MKKNERLIWTCVLATSIAFNVLFFAAPARADASTYHQYQQILQNVFHYVRTMHVDVKSEKQLLIGAIRGMLRATGDPYTRFLDRDQFREFTGAQGGKKVGIGVQVSMDGAYPVIIAPVEGGPAAKAGVLAGDHIIAINGKSVKNADFGDVLKLIKGEIGTVVELKVRREFFRKPIEIKITRGLFNLTYVRHAYLAGGRVGYVRLAQFFGENSGAVSNFRKYLLEFKARNVRGIIVDLRNNPGGLLNMAADLTSFFVQPGRLIVSVRGRNETFNKSIKASAEAGLIPERIAVIVLINKGSASASEIMAGALQDYGRAKLIGEQSFGKFSVQRIIGLPDDTAVFVTVQFRGFLNEKLLQFGDELGIHLAGRDVAQI